MQNETFTFGSCMRRHCQANIDTHICIYIPAVEWILALGFKAMPLKEERQLRAAFL